MGYEFQQYVDIYLKVRVQKFVDMGGGFAFNPLSKTFLDLSKAKNFILSNEGIWEIQEMDKNKWGVRKVEIHLINYPEPIIINKCNKPQEELKEKENVWIGIKYITKCCCELHSQLNAIVPEEVKDFYDMKYEEAKKVKH